MGRKGIVFNPGPRGIINVLLDENDVVIQANQQGFRALAKVFLEFAEGGPETGDVHGDPGMELLDDSEQVVIEYDYFNPGPNGIVNILLAGNDVHIQANLHGFYALAKVFDEFADGRPEAGDIHGYPGINLDDDSEQLTIEYYHEPEEGV